MKYKIGYTRKEVEAICKKEKIPMDKFWDKFGVNTCPVLPNGEGGYFKHDVELAIRCCKENRDKYIWEWD